jgi:hypothetical protein
MRPKWKIYLEQAKDRQTSHWDWDCMTRAQIDEALRESCETENRSSSRSGRSFLHIWRNLMRSLKRVWKAGSQSSAGAGSTVEGRPAVRR